MSTDLERLQGVWHIASLEVDGVKTDTVTVDIAQIVIDGDKFTSLAMGAEYEGILKLGQTEKRKTFDLLFTTGPEKGTRNLGIYKLEGDRWTICLATHGDKRPGKFATQTGSGFALETLEREPAARKETKLKDHSPARRSHPSMAGRAKRQVVPDGSVTELEGEWEMISAIFSGAPLAPDMVRWCRRITRGNITTVVAGPQTMLKASFTLDNTVLPHTIDYMNLHGAAKGKAQAGIYELSDRTLKICMAPPGKNRPLDYVSKSADGRSYTTWRLIAN